jgi:hypothetical protein
LEKETIVIYATAHYRRLAPAALAVIALLCPTVVAQTPEETLLRDAAQRSVAVAAVLDMPHESPAERLNAVFTLLDLGELDVAATLLNPVLKADLDDAARAQLVSQFGTARFLDLALRDPPVAGGETSPLAGARDFARRCMKAAGDRARDPKRLAQLIAQLNDPSDQVRNAARVDLAVTGTAGAQACLEALAQAEDETSRANLLLALTGCRPEVDPLLLAVLADGTGHVLRDAAEFAGHVGMLDAAPLLAAIAVSEQQDPETNSAAQTALGKLGLSRADVGEARGLLLGEIRRLEAGVPVDHQAADTLWWTFSAATGELTSQEFPAEARQLLTIARLAKALGALPHATPQDEQTALLYAYQAARQLHQPLSPPLQQLAESLAVADLSVVLGDAIRHDQIAAATACAELLGQRGDVAALTSLDARPSPLAQALKHPDRRLRFAALEAVMQISPQQTFPGASGVPPALWRFAAGAGAPQAVAASSVVTRASDWAGQLRGLGYDATPATTGREALEIAIRAPRLALMLVDSDIGRPLLREVLYQLRGNSATARVPVAILSSLPNLQRAQQLAENDSHLIAVVRPPDQAALAEIVERLTEMETSLGTPEERTQQAAQALEWIAALLETGHPYDELLRDADAAGQSLFVPELLEPSLKVLAALGTAGSQRTLVDFVSNSTASLEMREEAVRAFAASVQRHGKLLTPTEVSMQFDRYNASETSDRGTQQVLGQLLDVLEDKPLAPLNP